LEGRKQVEDFPAVLYDQARGHGNGAFGCKVDHRGAWRRHLGHGQSGPGRHLPFLVARGAQRTRCSEVARSPIGCGIYSKLVPVAADRFAPLLSEPACTCGGKGQGLRVPPSMCTAGVWEVAATSSVCAFTISCANRITFPRTSKILDRTKTVSPANSSFLYARRCSTAATPQFESRKYAGVRPMEASRFQVASSNLPAYH